MAERGSYSSVCLSADSISLVCAYRMVDSVNDSVNLITNGFCILYTALVPVSWERTYLLTCFEVQGRQMVLLLLPEPKAEEGIP